MDSIDVKNLTREFKDILNRRRLVTVDNVSLRVEKDAIVYVRMTGPG